MGLLQTMIGRSIRFSDLEFRLFEQRRGFREPLACQINRPPLQFDLSAQFVTTPPPEGATARELAFGRFEPSFSRITRCRKCTAPLLEKPAAHLLIRAEP